MADRARTGALLRLYLGLTACSAPLLRRHLARRVARGREDAARVAEKRGVPSLPRPAGRLVWMHAVGVGEVLALPGLIAAVRARAPDAQVLVTSSSRTSGQAIAANLPDGARHQYLPLDCPVFTAPFLDHWRPDLAVWAERDVWPGLVVAAARRGMPQAIVNARMNAASFRAKRPARSLFRDIYARMAFIGAQDTASAAHFTALGADRVSVTGSLKAAAPPLADQPGMRARLGTVLAGRRVWIAASTHPGEEAIVAQAHRALLADDPAACLIVAPRDPVRAEAVRDILAASGLSAAVLPPDNALPRRCDAYVVARIGQLGLWYRLADAAFVGGSLVPVGGHNPYEPARLGAAILHGPHVDNFAADYAVFHAAGAALPIADAAALAAALNDAAALSAQVAPAAAVAEHGQDALGLLADRLVALLPGGR